MSQAMLDNLTRWRKDVCAWAEEVLWCESPTTGELGPLRLQPHQRHFLREATRRGHDGRFVRKVAVASWPKREGKTLCVSILLAWRMACFTNQQCGVIACSERQAASNIFEACTGFFKDSPALQGLVPEDGFQTRKLAVPELGNVAECYPANYRTVQGTRFHVLAVDELHAADDGGKAYAFASQQTEAADAQVLVSSQAGVPLESNPLWRLHLAAQAGDGHILFDYRQDVATPWAQARAEAAKTELLPGEHDYLWRNCWAATGQTLFSTDQVAALFKSWTQPQSLDEWQDLCASWGLRDMDDAHLCLGGGLDRNQPGAGRDRAVWSVSASFLVAGQRYFALVGQEVLPTGAEAEVLAAVERSRRIFGRYPMPTICESYQCADLARRIPHAQLEAASGPAQERLYRRLIDVGKESRLALPADALMLREELTLFSYSIRPGGGVKFKTQAAHDDTVDSLVWSLEAAASRALFDQCGGDNGGTVVTWAKAEMPDALEVLPSFEEWSTGTGPFYNLPEPERICEPDFDATLVALEWE